MYTVRKVTDDLFYVGGDDRRLALFENIFPIDGVSYNSYPVSYTHLNWHKKRRFAKNF